MRRWGIGPVLTISAAGVGLGVGSVAVGQEGDSAPLAAMSEVLSDVARAEGVIDEALAARIGALADVEAGLLRRTEFYAATFSLQEGESMRARILVMPTESADDPGRLGIAVDTENGEVLMTALWGRTTFDDDVEGNWLAFTSQFKPPSGLGSVLDPDDAPAHDELLALAEEGSGGTHESGIPMITLYRHRYMMLKNSANFTRIGVIRKHGRMFTEDELRDWVGGMLWLCGQADTFEPIIGAAAAQQYKDVAPTIQEIFGAAIEAAQQEDHEDVAKAIGPLYRNVCQSCHDADDHPLGERTIYWDLREKLPELGVRSDLGRIGLDTWGPRGEERELSKILARQVRAGLLILGMR